MSETYNAQIFLGRQPILGREQQLLAYTLFFRPLPILTGSPVTVDDPAPRPAAVAANAFAGLNVDETLGPYRWFINAAPSFLFSDTIETLPPARVVLEIRETAQPAPEVIERCRQLCALGFSLAVDDVLEFGEACRPLFELAEIIEVDVQNLDADQLAARVEKLKPFGKKLLAGEVASNEHAEQCKRLGFELFQGYYFARPAVIVGEKLEPSQISLLHLLGLVMRDAETNEIENAFKVEPVLTIDMLRLTNSVSNGLPTRVTSLRHAITLLGRSPLRRWLQLLICTSSRDGSKVDNPLLPLAATRGRLMELLIERQQPHNREFADQAFLVGVMSLMPVLLGAPMGEILGQLPIAQRVKQALLEREGLLGLLLRLVLSTEQTAPEAIGEALRGVPGISVRFLEDSLRQALFWANNIERENVDAA
jgi:EAL and modified HD-GYP domain-containing signal transduction protein